MSAIDKRHSRLGIVSFSTSISAAVSLFLLIIVAGVIELRTPGGVDDSSLQAVAIGLFAIGALLLDVIAFILGFIALFQTDRKKLFALLGMIFSGLTIAVFSALVVVGLNVG